MRAQSDREIGPHRFTESHRRNVRILMARKPKQTPRIILHPISDETRRQLTELVVSAIHTKRAFYRAWGDAQDALLAYYDPCFGNVHGIATDLVMSSLEQAIYCGLYVEKTKKEATRIRLDWDELLAEASKRRAKCSLCRP
jgi:hypothetical protein